MEDRCHRLVLVGEGREFVALLDHVRADASLEAVPLATLEQLASMEQLRRPPRFVLLLQSRPGQFLHGELAALQRALPDTHWLCVVGSFAEGETRSGQPVPGVDRVYWSAAIDRFTRLRELWENERESDSDPFALAKPADRLLALNQGDRPYPYGLGVVAANAAVAEPVIGACEAAGFCAEWLPSERLQATARGQFDHLNLCIWMQEVCQACGPVPLDQVVARVAPCPVLAICDFTRAVEAERLREDAGAAAVLTRPFVLQDLIHQISRLARPSTLPASRPSTQRHRHAS